MDVELLLRRRETSVGVPSRADRKRIEGLALRLARDYLKAQRPMSVARRAGVRYRSRSDGGGFFDLTCLNRRYRVTYPDGLVKSADTAEEPDHALCLLILHYLGVADGQRLADRWVAFRELPGGLVYERVLRQRSEPPLVSAFGQNLGRFRAAGRALGGRPIDFGDAAFMIDALPRVRMSIILHRGDEEFPSTARVLYDGAAGHYLPTEDLAILGELLVRASLKASSV